MGLFSAFYSISHWIKKKTKDAIARLMNKLAEKKYDETSVTDHVDVDAVLAEVRISINDDVIKTEKKCMNTISDLFGDLIKKTNKKFPDLVEIIKYEQERAENELKGTIMKYVKEHLSENNSRFLKVLKMNPGQSKNDALNDAVEKVLMKAEKEFNLKLKQYAEDLLKEFKDRLNSRILEQERYMNYRIDELERLQEEAEKGKVDIDALKDQYTPMMESAECIIQLLEMK